MKYNNKEYTEYGSGSKIHMREAGGQKNAKSRIGRAFAVLLAGVMTFSLAACGKGGKGGDAGSTGAGGSGGSAAEEKEFVWVPQFIELSDEESGSFYNMQIKDGVLYYLNYEWDGETGESSVTLNGISFADGTKQMSLPIEQESGEENSSRNIEQFAMTSDGGFFALASSYTWDEATGNGTRKYYVCRYDGNGKKTAETELESDERTYFSMIALDKEERVYLAGDSQIYLLDSEANLKGKIDAGNDAYIFSLGMDKDGVMCAAINEYGGPGRGSTLKEIDFDAKTFGAVYTNFPSGYNSGALVPGIEKSALVSDGSRVYEYDKQSQAYEELFCWLDSDINGNHVNCMATTEDGRIAVVMRDWESSRAELALLTRTKASETVQKTVITVSTLYENSSLQSAAVKFNKSNDKYRISIKSYYDYNLVTGDNYQQVMNDALDRLNNDITSKNCPDMLDLTQLNMQQLASKGLLEDLGPYLDKSTVTGREDFIESLLNSFTYEGKLLTIPRTFELMTVVGKTSEVGPTPGWTLEEMLAYANAHPGAAVFDYGTRDSILQFMVAYNQNAFVDWKTGECKFNTDSFKKLLEFTNKFPDEYDWTSDDDRSTPAKIAAGDVLLNTEYIYDFESVQMAEGIFGEPVTFIGYPNDEGTSGSYIQANNGLLAITTKSDKKDGAWEFLESYLTAEVTWNDFGLPANKAALQEKREAATRVEYLLDENGEKILDENGEPITMNGGGSMSYQDGWTYEYHITTEEEADKLMALIEVARPVTDSDTQIMNIISEEAAAYFKGDKSADDVAGIIQSRVQVYVNENR